MLFHNLTWGMLFAHCVVNKVLYFDIDVYCMSTMVCPSSQIVICATQMSGTYDTSASRRRLWLSSWCCLLFRLHKDRKFMTFYVTLKIMPQPIQQRKKNVFFCCIQLMKYCWRTRYIKDNTLPPPPPTHTSRYIIWSLYALIPKKMLEICEIVFLVKH